MKNSNVLNVWLICLINKLKKYETFNNKQKVNNIEVRLELTHPLLK